LATQSAPSRLSRWRIQCRASFPSNPQSSRPGPLPPRSRLSRRGCRRPERSTRLHRADRRLALLAGRARGRRLPASKHRLRSALVPAQRADRPLFPASILLAVVPSPGARSAYSRLPLRHICSEGARRGCLLPGRTQLGTVTRRQPSHRDCLSLGPGGRVHSRLAWLPCLSEDDLCADDARPLLAQGGRCRRDRPWADPLRRSG
jgi:hypothetical protein